MMDEFNAVFEWNMTNDEISVYKIALLYQEQYVKIFGDKIDGQAIRINTLPKKTDPRKSSLFRYCWKLRRETRGLLEGHEFKHYLLGNLTLLRITSDRTGSPITPMSVTGDKGWIRYKIWKRKYDEKLAEVSATQPPPSVSGTSPKIIHEIDRNKKFLFEKCDGVPTAAKIKEFVDSGIFKFWVMTGKVSHYYCVLSPYMAVATDITEFADKCNFSANLIREKCTPEVQNYFKHEYTHEFKQ